ncbi:MAG: helix-turn-helix domain-containing protein, partial [Acidimicrobiales bacterium]
LVIHGATGEVPAAVLQASRARTDDEWAAAEARLRDRGWLDADGALTEAGRAHRQWVEDRTDQLALAPWQHLGLDGCNRLRELVRPLSKAIVASGTLGFRPDQ